MNASTVDDLLHYEDFPVGTVIETDTRAVTREEIIAFATAYDPQAIHIDEDAARKSLVGGLCAAGMHTCALMMRLLCDRFLLRSASLGSPGLDEVKWMKPVRPGDTLKVRILCQEARIMASRPNVGIVRAEYGVINQHGETVLAAWSNQMFRVRTPRPADSATQPSQKAPKSEIRSLWGLDPAAAPLPASLYFEDRIVDELVELGSETFTPEAIIAFARLYDPQPFHLDPEAGRRSLFKGHAASGWHTAAIFIKLFVHYRQSMEADFRAKGHPDVAYGPSPGFKNLRWLKPVLAGDTITYRSRVSGKVDLKSRPERGLLLGEHQGRNQHGELVFLYSSQIMVQRRAPYVAPAG